MQHCKATTPQLKKKYSLSWQYSPIAYHMPGAGLGAGEIQ